ncbi:DUF397 domain-containing protein [Kitasatospora sp. NBC_01287]|uniref:DUF397 domain-containing protein n=1 Tax=Kitasatospora sp. NBC_01287 TaxID=2903573 RepID=UPI00224D3F76|nr:DUF397 domain-containing protein [Kitasatospora sp. NBC_01287]MCX4750265.1 DUF397 domain-containing protein [Kitasatospora sp. NBC_01287]
MESFDSTDVNWFKSSHSNGQSNCVEIAFLTNKAVPVRDSKDPAGPALIFPTPAWHSFIAGVQLGTLPIEF